MIIYLGAKSMLISKNGALKKMKRICVFLQNAFLAF